MDTASSRTAVRDPLHDQPPPTARPAHERLLIWATGLSLAAATALVGCRVIGVDGVTPVPQLLAFLPWSLVPIGVAAVFAVLLRWRGGLVWALVVLAVAGRYGLPYGPQAATATTATATATETGTGTERPVVAHLEVLTSNVEFGQATLGLIETVRREQPDVVFVQECEYICAQLLNARIPRADYPYRHVVKAGQAEGSAILSVLPLTDTDGIEGTLSMPGSEAVVGGRTVRLQLVHPLPPVPGGVDAWRRELDRIRTYATAHRDAPLILAGDFNATRDHAAFRAVLDGGELRDSAALAGAGRTPSWPAAVPRPLGAQIDHVLISKDFSVRRARFLDLADTDHRALLVGLDLHAPARR
ncbi:endonuclease/exonuclease/phosphatase family protein [Streptomyces sp. NPDC059743]|uniref:endonuclease/exonuclease/phosphatase family protein n=1 Tax=Streptomyces sp. NPDC059743 TaxID=3346928 RepID=UPI0036635343